MMVCLSLKLAARTLMMAMIVSTCTSQSPCPRSCSFISPIPYPFGAAEGCGAPGFQISNCSSSPQWNLLLGDTLHVYYIQSIRPISNSSKQSSVLNYGYGGAVLLSLPTPSNTPFCGGPDPLSPLILSSFSSSNMYAFQGGTLSFYEQHYLLFNCSQSGLSLQAPSSGAFTPSGSQPCLSYLKRCNLSAADRCLDYAPDKELYLPTLMSTYNCSYFRRFVIAHDDDPIDSWIVATQFAWEPVKDADSCNSCENTGGTCGYNTQDNSFLCFCGNETYQQNCNRKQSGHIGVIVGVPLAVVFLVASALIAYYFHHNLYSWRSFANQKRLSLEGVNEAPIEFPYGALAAATKSFQSEIGRGAFGKVYKGQLPDGNEVAVKVLDASISDSDEVFVNEVAAIGNIHHMHVARLFGFCFRRSKKILVYEYVCNGSLDKYLFPDEERSCPVVLSWKQRFDIALGIARGLSYMHEECRKFIIHCDIKPQNILLDASYCPKVSDFGLAKLLTREESRVLTHARGTPGYVAPEFWSSGSGPLTSKFDVYSYGMVLLEIVRGQRSFFHMVDPFSLQEADEHISEWSSVFVDKRIVQNADPEQARICTLVALWCVQEDPSLRPTMGKVVQYLQGTASVPNPPLPFRKIGKHEESSWSKHKH